MHICRIRYTVLGLLIYYLQNAFSSSCVSDFDDVASKTVMADIVIEGQFYREIPIKEMPGFYNIRFNKVTLIKGDVADDSPPVQRNSKGANGEQRKDKKHGSSQMTAISQPGQKNGRNRPGGSKELSIPIVVGLFGPTHDPSECVYARKSMSRGQRYLVFLSNPDQPEIHANSRQDYRSRRYRRRASSQNQNQNPYNNHNNHNNHNGHSSQQQQPQQLVYRMSSFPVAASNTARKEAKNHSCQNCGKIPKIAKMTKSMNVTEGRRVKVTCRSTGFPKPEMYWIKNGLLYEPEGNSTIKERKQSSVLTIKNARDEDAGQYQCYALNVLGQSNLSSCFVNVLSRSKKPFSEPCQDQGYCVNGGTCYRLTTRRHIFCQCAGDYIGERCEEKNTGYIALIGRKRKRHLPGFYRPRRRFYP